MLIAHDYHSQFIAREIRLAVTQYLVSADEPDLLTI